MTAETARRRHAPGTALGRVARAMEMRAAQPKRDRHLERPAFRQNGTGHAGIHWNLRAAGLALAPLASPRCERRVPVRDAPARDEDRRRVRVARSRRCIPELARRAPARSATP